MTIYLDNAASTPPAPEVVDALAAASRVHYANASSVHRPGTEAARALETARTQVAALLRAESADIVFTSGGTEADALGVLGAAAVARGRHVVLTAIEHPAVLRSAESLRARGFEVTRVAPGRDGAGTGVVAVQSVIDAIRADTALVAVMLVNNEIGTVQPVPEIARALGAAGRRAPAPHFHVDAVQAAGFLPIDVRTLGADTVAISGHKFHGPKGAGALWVRRGARLGPLWEGGGQEHGLRSGTENVPAWVALGCAAELGRGDSTAAVRVAALRDRFEALATAAVPGARPTTPGAPRAPHIASLVLPNLPAEPILHALETRGVIASAGSACASRHRGPSRVLAAIGIGHDDAVLRFSLSRLTTTAEIEGAAAALREAVDEIGSVTGSSAARAGGKNDGKNDGKNNGKNTRTAT